MLTDSVQIFNNREISVFMKRKNIHIKQWLTILSNSGMGIAFNSIRIGKGDNKMKNFIRLVIASIAITLSFNASAYMKRGGGSDYQRDYTKKFGSYEYRMPKKKIQRSKCWIGCGERQKAKVDISFIPKKYNEHDLRKIIKKLRMILISKKMGHDHHYPGCGHDKPDTPTNDVPEPGILGLVAIGLLGMVLVRRKKSA